MNFKEATDGLFHRISHAELAKMLSVSVAAIRQARLSRTAKANRGPPRNWHHAIIRAQEKSPCLLHPIAAIDQNRPQGLGGLWICLCEVTSNYHGCKPKIGNELRPVCQGARLVLALSNCWPTSPTSFLRILVGGERWSLQAAPPCRCIAAIAEQ